MHITTSMFRPATRSAAVVRRLATTALAVGAVLTAASCGSDADAAELVDQYCAMVADVERHAEQVFTQAAEDADGADLTTEQMFGAEREVLIYIEAQGYDRMDKPAAIADDWATFFDGFSTKLAAATPEPPSVEAQAAEERLLTWEDANCGN